MRSVRRRRSERSTECRIAGSDHDRKVAVVSVRANVRTSATNLRHGSDILEQLIEREELLVVGAEYSLETGVVEFFEGLPA